MEETNIQLVNGLLGSTFPLGSNTLSILALSLIGTEPIDGGIFSRITMTSMTSKWYLRLGHFEAILVGLVVLQIFVMRYFLILPLDVTKLIEDGTLLATSVSRKRRSSAFIPSRRDVIHQQRLAETMFSILRRLDENDCFLRTLCELENNSKSHEIKPGKLQTLLTTLKRLGLERIKLEKELLPNNTTILERKVLAEFEDAVLLSEYGTEIAGDTCEQKSESLCANRYSLCNADKSELLGYVNDIMPFMS